MIQDKFPWLYNIGKELLDILSSQQDIDIKKESIRNFQKIVEISFEHPIMRETYMRQKDEFLMIRDMVLESWVSRFVGAFTVVCFRFVTSQ